MPEEDLLGMCYGKDKAFDFFTTNAVLSRPVKRFLKSVNIRQIYKKKIKLMLIRCTKAYSSLV